MPIKYIIVVLLASFFSIYSSSIATARGTVILLVDTSSSITDDQSVLQLGSYAKAMTRIAALNYVDIKIVTFGSSPKLIYEGDNNGAAEAFINAMAAKVITPRGSTCLGAALELIHNLVNDIDGKIVLDISGDGEANCKNRRNISYELDKLSDKGVQINTLYIKSNGIMAHPGNTTETPEDFFKSMVRNSGFSISVHNYDDFELSLFEKLAIEVSWIDNIGRYE